MSENQKRWKHKIVWAVCDQLVDEQGLAPQDITDSKLVEALKVAGHAPGNPNQRLKYLKEWKLNQLNCISSSDDSGDSDIDYDQVNQSLIDNMTRKFEQDYQARLEERDNEIVHVANQLAEAKRDLEQQVADLDAAEVTKQQQATEIATLKEANEKLSYENSILQQQVSETHKQTDSVEGLLNKITSAHEEILSQKTQALKNEYENELVHLRQQNSLFEKILSEKDALVAKLDEENQTYQKKYIAIKEDSDNWEGEKKRLQIELAKSRSKQFTNEFMQFTESYKSFTQKFMNDSQQQSHKYITQCFERLLKLVSYEMRSVGNKSKSD